MKPSWLKQGRNIPAAVADTELMLPPENMLKSAIGRGSFKPLVLPLSRLILADKRLSERGAQVSGIHDAALGVGEKVNRTGVPSARRAES